jgi:protein O-GlcNAc transferase
MIAATAYRPAPVQFAWLGYPFTTGLKDMDYVLVDRYFKPVGEIGLTEKPLVMDGSWTCFGEDVFFEAVEIAPMPPVDRNGVVTFGTLNNTYKYTPRMFSLWSEAMKRVPNSRFLVVRPACGSFITCRNITQEFAKNGIDSDRIYFINNLGKNLSHLAYYNEIDICLDTFPLTGGTTTHESLWMGVPVVSLVGPALHQRISYALLKHVGLDECCAESPEEYVDRAVALAKNVERIRDLRANLRGMIKNSQLVQPELFAENFETAMMDLAVKHGLC